MSIESEEEGSTARSNVAAKGGENPPLTYSRDEMMILREGKLSRTRPDYLGIDFDGLVQLNLNICNCGFSETIICSLHSNGCSISGRKKA